MSATKNTISVPGFKVPVLPEGIEVISSGGGSPSTINAEVENPYLVDKKVTDHKMYLAVEVLKADARRALAGKRIVQAWQSVGLTNAEGGPLTAKHAGSAFSSTMRNLKAVQLTVVFVDSAGHEHVDGKNAPFAAIRPIS